MQMRTVRTAGQLGDVCLDGTIAHCGTNGVITFGNWQWWITILPSRLFPAVFLPIIVNEPSESLLYKRTNGTTGGLISQLLRSETLFN